MAKGMTIEQFKKDMDKKFGEGTLIELGNEDNKLKLETLTTGIPSLDLALGNGGLARGRIVEIFGGESGGKTSLTSFLIATVQKMAGKNPHVTYDPADTSTVIKPISGRVGLIDVEHAYDPVFAEKLGVNISPSSGFYLIQPMSGSEALDEMQMMVDSGLFDYVILDSVAGLLSGAEDKADHGDKQIAQVATLMSTGLRKLTASISSSRTIAIFINQIREKPAVMFGSPETTPGGRSLKFHASYRLRISKTGQLKRGSNVIGHSMKIHVQKNKTSIPFKSTEIDFYYEEQGELGSKDYKPVGFDIWSDTINTARELGIIKLGGSQYSYVNEDGEVLFKVAGKVELINYLSDNPDMMDLIKKDMIEGKN